MRRGNLGNLYRSKEAAVTRAQQLRGCRELFRRQRFLSKQPEAAELNTKATKLLSALQLHIDDAFLASKFHETPWNNPQTASQLLGRTEFEPAAIKQNLSILKLKIQAKTKAEIYEDMRRIDNDLLSTCFRNCIVCMSQQSKTVASSSHVELQSFMENLYTAVERTKNPDAVSKLIEFYKFFNNEFFNESQKLYSSLRKLKANDQAQFLKSHIEDFMTLLSKYEREQKRIMLQDSCNRLETTPNATRPTLFEIPEKLTRLLKMSHLEKGKGPRHNLLELFHYLNHPDFYDILEDLYIQFTIALENQKNRHMQKRYITATSTRISHLQKNDPTQYTAFYSMLYGTLELYEDHTPESFAKEYQDPDFPADIATGISVGDDGVTPIRTAPFTTDPEPVFNTRQAIAEALLSHFERSETCDPKILSRLFEQSATIFMIAVDYLDQLKTPASPAKRKCCRSSLFENNKRSKLKENEMPSTPAQKQAQA